MGVEKDENKAFEWYKKSASQGDSNVQYSLGCCYENGIGTKPDYKKAVKWYENAAEQGDFIAQYNLGCFYRTGEGVVQNDDLAYKYFLQSAENGYAPAMYKGMCYEHGVGTDEDIDAAIDWYNRAADSGDELAKEKLKEL